MGDGHVDGAPGLPRPDREGEPPRVAHRRGQGLGPVGAGQVGEVDHAGHLVELLDEGIGARGPGRLEGDLAPGNRADEVVGGLASGRHGLAAPLRRSGRVHPKVDEGLLGEAHVDAFVAIEAGGIAELDQHLPAATPALDQADCRGDPLAAECRWIREAIGAFVEVEADVRRGERDAGEVRQLDHGPGRGRRGLDVDEGPLVHQGDRLSDRRGQRSRRPRVPGDRHVEAVPRVDVPVEDVDELNAGLAPHVIEVVRRTP